MTTSKDDLRSLPLSALQQRRAFLLATLPPLHEVLHGSLITRFIRCGKPNCHCATGQGHGPHFYLSSLGPNRRTRLDYVPAAWENWVRQRLDNLHRIHAVLAELGEINRELLRRRERDE